MQAACGRSHGKIILLGEHSVVYGQPSLAIPFKATTIEVTLEPAGNHSFIFSDLYEGPVQGAPIKLDALVGLFNLLRRDYEVEHYHLLITIKSTIPIERGMGSSAALSVAMVRAFFQYIDKDLDQETLLRYVDYAEVISHGNPSGLDARVTALDQPLFFVKDQTMDVFYFDTPYWLVVADTGVPGNTKEAVADVREAYDSDYSIRHYAVNHAIQEMGRLTSAFHQELKADQVASCGDLGSYLHDYQHYLKLLQVSSPELDYLIDYCEQHGASGAKLTGGGRGGCLLALVPDQDQAGRLSQELESNFPETTTWTMPFTSR